MSMNPQSIPEIPPETVRVVRAAFPKGNIYTWLRDTLGTIYQDEFFADLYPSRGQPAYAAWRLALVTIFQLILVANSVSRASILEILERLRRRNPAFWSSLSLRHQYQCEGEPQIFQRIASA